MSRLLRDYGMVLVLLALCVLFSLSTIAEQTPTGKAAARQMCRRVAKACEKGDVIFVVGKVKKESAKLAKLVAPKLKAAGFTEVRMVVGEPTALTEALDDIEAKNRKLAAIVTAGKVLKWEALERIRDEKTHPLLADYRLVVPESYYWPNFLKGTNLLAIVNRIVIIAIIAIGMTMVIITGGIDLSVGSLISLSAIVSTMTMLHLGGGDAAAWVVPVGFLAGILACGLAGGLGGFLVARFRVPPFITTLAMMMMARGLARVICGGKKIKDVPEALPWLGQGWSLGIPHSVLLLVVLYAAAHIFMSRTRIGRYIYAVGGNEEAARLSGVPVMFVIIFVYVVSGMAAGLGGCIEASRLGSGTHTIGVMDELYVIAAVVVGGTSLSGGSGRILGTLIGAFIIAVIQNGMNLLGMKEEIQMIVLGGVILIAVLLDKLCAGAVLSSLIKKQLDS